MPETVKRLKRSALLHYVNAKPSEESPAWYLIGKDVSDMSMELNPDTEAVKNILDETSVQDNGYEPSMEVDTYYADPSDGDFYTFIKDIAMDRKTGADCETQLLEVLVDKTEGPYDAWRENVIIKPTSYGGEQGGVRIPYTITPNGERTKGTVTIEKRESPVFTDASEAV